MDFCIKLVLLILCSCLISSKEEIRKEHVKVWSKEIARLTHAVMDNYLRRSRIQMIFDNMKYSVQEKNGNIILKKASSRLSGFFKDREYITKNLASKVEELYRKFMNESKNSSVEANITELHNVPREYFVDADFIQKENLSYSPFFRRSVTFNESFVKLPDQADRTNKDLIDTVIWSSGLDQLFKQHKEDSRILWQYFASHYGINRIYPGFEWERDFMGFPVDYDPRIRPWYVSAISGPKDVVIILDCSSSMIGHRFDLSKDIAKTILQTLTHEDYFTILCGRASHWDKQGNWHEYIYDGQIVGCNKAMLVRADSKNKEDYLKSLDSLTPGGTSEVRLAFRKAFNMIRKRDGCQSIIIFTTDGINNDGGNVRCNQGQYARTGNFVPGKKCVYKWSKVFNEVNKQKKLSVKKTRIFTYLIDSKEEELAGKLACHNGGAMKKIATKNDLLSQMFDYYNFLTLNTIRDNDIVWSAPYIDSFGFGKMVTCTVPVVSHIDNQTLGVVAVDLSLTKIDKILSSFTWGDVYAFVINKDGQAIFHPALDRHSGALETDMPYVSIFDLEQINGKPALLKDLVIKMTSEESGSIHIQDSVAYDFTISLHKRIEPEAATFYYASISDSGYSFAFKIPDSDNILVQKDIIEQLNDKFTELFFADSLTNTDLTNSSSKNTVLSVSSNTSWYSCLKSKTVRSDGETIHVHKDANKICLKLSRRSLFLPNSSVKSLPGFHVAYDGEESFQQWYHASIDKPTLAIITRLRRSSQSIIKISSGIFPKSADVPTNSCLSTNRKNGCLCKWNNDCASKNCRNINAEHSKEDQHRCSSSFVKNVIAADVPYNDFYDSMAKIMTLSGSNSPCWRNCTSYKAKKCKTKCFLIDTYGNILYHPLLKKKPDMMMTLKSEENSVMQQLTQKYSVFREVQKIDFQGVCRISASIPMVDLLQPVNISFQRNIALFRNKYSCVKHWSIFEKNGNHESIATTVNTPCMASDMFLEEIAGTNLLLLVLNNYTNLENEDTCLNWRVKEKGSSPLAEEWCHHRQDLYVHAPDVKRTVNLKCPKLRNVNMKCTYNTAPVLFIYDKMIFMCFLLNFILNLWLP